LVVQSFDENENQIERMFYPINLVYRNKAIDSQMLHHFLIKNFKHNTKTLKVYIWNKNLETFEVENGKCYIYALKNI
jgi:predicted transglutaminase-like protease